MNRRKTKKEYANRNQDRKNNPTIVLKQLPRKYVLQSIATPRPPTTWMMGHESHLLHLHPDQVPKTAAALWRSRMEQQASFLDG
jgi:hypothetical protein